MYSDAGTQKEAIMFINVIKNINYPKHSNIPNIVVKGCDDGLEIIEDNKKDSIKLSIEGEMRLLELIAPHLKSIIK